MKKIILCAVTALAISIGIAPAALPTYRSFTAGGNSTTGATVIMPADPNSQIRVVSILYQSDKAGTGLSFSTGAGAYSIQLTNASSSNTTNYLNSTNGLLASSVMVLQQGGNVYSATISSYGNSGASGLNSLTNQVTGPNGLSGAQATNVSWIVLGSGAWGVVANSGADVYQMSATTGGYTVGASTNGINGDDIYSGNYGRPVSVVLSVATTTNQLNSVSAHYDSASN